MTRRWTPKCHVSVTDAGMVIEVEMEGIQTGSLALIPEENQLRILGQHEDFGAFETRLAIPPGHSLANATARFAKGRLRIEVPPGKDATPARPRTMLIYCDACGKHFDISITGKGPRKYRCPICGTVQVFDLDALVKKAIEQGYTMLKRRRGRRG